MSLLLINYDFYFDLIYFIKFYFNFFLSLLDVIYLIIIIKYYTLISLSNNNYFYYIQNFSIFSKSFMYRQNFTNYNSEKGIKQMNTLDFLLSDEI